MLGDPLHPITAGERLVGQWWAAGFVTLAVTVCDPGVARQSAGTPRRPERELGAGIGREMSRRGRGRRQDACGLHEKEGHCSAFAWARAGRQPTEADVICWFERSRRVIYKKKNPMVKCDFSNVVRRQKKCLFTEVKNVAHDALFCSPCSSVGADRGCVLYSFHTAH